MSRYSGKIYLPVDHRRVRERKPRLPRIIVRDADEDVFEDWMVAAGDMSAA